MANEKSNLFAELVAEFLGTFVLIVLGDGVVAMVVLFGDPSVKGEVVKGGYTNITLGWGLAVMMGIFIAGRISGAHLNPAVTLALAVFRGFSWRKVIPYTAAQVAGAFVAAALIYWNYWPAFHNVDPGLEKTAGVFTTFPYRAEGIAQMWAYGLLDQVVGTALLLALIFAIVDPLNRPVATWFQPVAIGLVVVAIGMSWGGMHGYAINPARDFGPRLFTLVAGFRNTGFENGVFWVPIVGPYVGGLVGATVYDGLIRRHLTTPLPDSEG
jgi:glycerol uptake facilitator protein